MTVDKFSKTITDLFRREEWERARELLEKEREKNPKSHWILTQLGVTLYEQRAYRKALEFFLASYRILPDCPLTLWNLAGAFDAMGECSKAMLIYTWLLKSKKTAADDPCWESAKWTDALKADCVYRLGACFQKLGNEKQAEHCYRQYLELAMNGVEGIYSTADATQRVRQLRESRAAGVGANQVRRVLKSALKDIPGVSAAHRKTVPLPLDEAIPRSGRRVAAKR